MSIKTYLLNYKEFMFTSKRSKRKTEYDYNIMKTIISFYFFLALSKISIIINFVHKLQSEFLCIKFCIYIGF